MISFYLFWCFGYLLLHGWLAKKWPTKAISVSSLHFLEKTSLIIPFRNELPNLPNLAQEVKKLMGTVGEVLLVDDQSEDGSFDTLSKLLSGIVGVHILKSPGQGKKAALTFGISCAKGEFILTSDADCQFTKNWVVKLTAPFESPEVRLVAGPVASGLCVPGFLQKFQQIEWFSILLLTQFSFAKKRPLTCSGANLAFRKSTFFEVEGYSGNERVLSGDDEFLLKKIVEKFGAGSCMYLPTPEVLVMTSAQTTWSNLFKQRIRWAGKWKVHRSFSHAFAAIFALSMQLVWVYGFYIFSQSSATWAMLGLILFLKILAEYHSLGKVGKSLGFRRDGLGFLFTSLAHPFYVVFVGLGTVFLKVSWKGRTQEVSVI